MTKQFCSREPTKCARHSGWLRVKARHLRLSVTPTSWNQKLKAREPAECAQHSARRNVMRASWRRSRSGPGNVIGLARNFERRASYKCSAWRWSARDELNRSQLIPFTFDVRGHIDEFNQQKAHTGPPHSTPQWIQNRFHFDLSARKRNQVPCAGSFFLVCAASDKEVE